VAHWLLKSEPHVYGWPDLVRDKRTNWNGVRNFAAAANLNAMRAGDTAFFYHSGEERACVGVMTVAREAYPDPSDETGRFVMVDVEAAHPLPRPVTLKAIKAEPRLAAMVLVHQSRLSVAPVREEEWTVVLEMAARAA